MTVHVTSLDLPKIAELLIDVGQRLHLIGDQAWKASQDFAYGPKATGTAPTTGDGSDHGAAAMAAMRALGHEPTGDAQSETPPPAPITTRPTNLLHARLRTTLGQIHDNADELHRLLGVLVPAQPRSRIVDCDSCGAPKPIDMKGTRKTDADEVVAEGWCASCHRLDGLLTPIEVDGNGNRYYARYCRWCGTFKGEHGREPALELLRIRHRHGRRVSLADVEKHCRHCKPDKRKAS